MNYKGSFSVTVQVSCDSVSQLLYMLVVILYLSY